jgi:hypothetical protein
MPGTYNHTTYTGSNLIWNPCGSPMEPNGLEANAPRIQFSAKYSFVKVDANK